MADYRNETTTRSSLVQEVRNVSFTGARKQSEILKELHPDMVVDNEPEVPMSSTPEQVIHYFEEIIAETSDYQKIRIYSQAIHWIKENEERKRDSIAAKIKAFNARNSEEADDLDEVTVE